MKPLVVFLIALAGGDGLTAQQPAPAAATPPSAPVSGPRPPADYVYEPGGRRDPFLNLTNRGTDTRPATTKGARPDGIAGVLVDEVAVRGIVESRGTWVAMIAVPNGRTYTIRPGDRLMDGSVHAINGQAVVLRQDVNNPLSLERHREVRKQLRGEAK